MAKEKKAVGDAFEKVEFLYAKGAIVNLETNPRYPDQVKWVGSGQRVEPEQRYCPRRAGRRFR